MHRTAETIAREGKALELRLAGTGYDQIATFLGYKSRGAAHAAVQRALGRTGGRREDSKPEQVADTELARLDAMLQGLWPRARKGDVAAIDRVLRIEERRAEIIAGDDQEKAAAEPPRTGLSDFEKRLAERDRAARAARRTASGS